MRLFSESIFAEYLQVALISGGDDPDAFPMWPEGEESWTLGPRGLAVAVDRERHVLVELYDDDPPEGAVDAGEFTVGDSGLQIGNELAGGMRSIRWPAGPVRVAFEREERGGQVEALRFFARRPVE